MDETTALLKAVLDRLEELNVAVTGLGAQVESLITKVDNLGARVDGLDARLTRMGAKVDNLDARMSMELRTTALERGFAEFRSDMNLRLGEIEHWLEYFADKWMEHDKELWRLKQRDA